MTESQINDLPQSVRHRFLEIEDSQFFDDSAVAEVRAQLAKFEVEHSKLVETAHSMRVRIEEIDERAAACRLEVARRSALRAEKIAEQLLDGRDLDADRAELEFIGKLDHFVSAVELAKPAMRIKFERALDAVRGPVSSAEGLNEKLRELIDQLKLAEAQRLAFA